MDSKEKVEVLVSCYDAFKKGELKNEPARLLCERILEDLEREEFECSDPDDSRAVVQAWFDECYYDDLGANGAWGVVVNDDGDYDMSVVYTIDYDSTFVGALELVKLAVEAFESGDAAPMPDWFERSWIGLTEKGARWWIEEMDEADVVRILAKRGIYAEDSDEPSYWVGYCEHSCPREALFDCVSEEDVNRRAEILEYA